MLEWHDNGSVTASLTTQSVLKAVLDLHLPERLMFKALTKIVYRLFLYHTADCLRRMWRRVIAKNRLPHASSRQKQTLLEYQNVSLFTKDLLPTIRHATRATQALSIKYLWADRPCIVQDDMDKWAHEASKICNIYEEAILSILTLSVDSSTSVWDGKFTEQPWNAETSMDTRPSSPVKRRIRVLITIIPIKPHSICAAGLCRNV